jgi:uncharacterized protein
MKVILDKKPKGPIIIEGFPGFGLVGTIATEYLIRHLGAVEIGRIRVKEVAPVIAVHEGKAVEPLGIFYSKKHNIVILHALTSVQGIEWDLADAICQLATTLKAKELISIEGIGGDKVSPDNGIYYIGKSKKLDTAGAREMEEGIIMGVSGALLTKKNLNATFIFAETASALPDSRAAAKIVTIIDKYLGLKVDPKPLMKKAEDFENKLKGIKEKKNQLSYLG